ncbi:MAG: phosphatidate cytidylyltransferase [Elusimicrobia bacterium]|nr:phosphatidate cytidylyltransferase [Elusimicrobiota bacterium]
MTAATPLVSFWSGIGAALSVATLAGWAGARLAEGRPACATFRDAVERIHSWWLMCAALFIAHLFGTTGMATLFGFVSFLALREFITIVPTRLSDHRTLLYAFFIFTPLQYALVGMRWYGLFAVMIPVYAFLFMPLRTVLRQDPARFLERTAMVQWALMVCVYCVSHVPALLMLRIPGYEGRGMDLAFYLILVVQMSDILQYIWGKLIGRHPIVPAISPNKTWAGFLGGIASATLLGGLLRGLTPFSLPQALGISLLVTLMGFAGGMTMSAIKRDRGIKDYGRAIPGHGGTLDRIDSLCFAAPVFFHLVRYYFT